MHFCIRSALKLLLESIQAFEKLRLQMHCFRRIRCDALIGGSVHENSDSDVLITILYTRLISWWNLARTNKETVRQDVLWCCDALGACNKLSSLRTCTKAWWLHGELAYCSRPAMHLSWRSSMQLKIEGLIRVNACMHYVRGESSIQPHTPQLLESWGPKDIQWHPPQGCPRIIISAWVGAHRPV